jgi:hypothetical protein
VNAFSGDGGAADVHAWAPSSYAGEDKSGSNPLWVGPGIKIEGAQRSFHKFRLEIPKGSTDLKAKVMQVVKGAQDIAPYFGWYLTAEYPLLKLGFLAFDGQWDALEEGGGVKGVQGESHWISQVLDTSSSQIFLTSIDKNGIDFAMHTDLLQNSFGMKFRASATQTLGSILARMRTTPQAAHSINVFMKVYSPISASDPRPGSLLAMSDPVAWSSFPTTYGTVSPPTGWVSFSFSGDDQIPITSGQEYVYVIDYSIEPTTAPWLQWANDDDRGGTPPQDFGNLPVANVYGISNVPAFGWHRNFYRNDDLFPVTLFSGIPYTDPFKPNTEDMNDGYENIWGDADYSPHAEIPLGSMVQDYIDDASYDESGTMLGIYVATADPDVGTEQGYESSKSPTILGMILTIEYAEPVPGKATNPNPPHFATEVDDEAQLSWTTGTYAGTAPVTHKVYFGTNPSPGAGEFQGDQPGNTFDPGPLFSGQTYYWRIDEVGEFETTTGDVWQFTVGIPEILEPTALITMIQRLISSLGVDLRKPATPDLVPVKPESLGVPETPQLSVSPHPSLEVPPGAEIHLDDPAETALEADSAGEADEASPGVSLDVNRGKLE